MQLRHPESAAWKMQMHCAEIGKTDISLPTSCGDINHRDTGLVCRSANWYDQHSGAMNDAGRPGGHRNKLVGVATGAVIAAIGILKT